MDEVDLAGLIALAREGDGTAIRELLTRFEDDVRKMVHARLPRALRSQFDSMDFTQAVWQSFFTRDRREPIPFENSNHLRGFLSGMVRNKVGEEYRRQTRTRKYDLSREEPLYVRRGNRDVPREVPAHDPSPSKPVQARDLMEKMLEGRSPEAAAVIELRGGELTFEEIAKQIGISDRSVRRIIAAVREEMEARGWQ